MPFMAVGGALVALGALPLTFLVLWLPLNAAARRGGPTS